MYFSRYFLSIFLFKYFSIIKLAIGAAHLVPQYPFSMKTAIAILGLSFGANPIKIE